MQLYSPTHSFMFNEQGQLLHANEAAVCKWRLQGIEILKGFTLTQLLRLEGTELPEAAAAACNAIFDEQQPSHRITLSHCTSSGARQHTLYEMWPAQDPVHRAPAMLVTALDVTGQQELAVELEEAKEQLQRRATNLELKMDHVTEQKDRLEKSHIALEVRLQQALQLHLAPKTTLDPQSPADKCVQLLDALLEGSMPSILDIVQSRNLLLSGMDLRAPVNLDTQLRTSAGLSTDVAQAMAELLQETGGAFTQQRPHPLRAFEASLSASRTSRSISTRALATRLGSLVSVAEHSWSFDVFELAEASNDSPLSVLAFYLIKRAGLIEELSLREDRLALFLQRIEAGYSGNPYHNRSHAAAVLQMMHLLITSNEGLGESGIMEPVTVLSAYLAAACHDFRHPGLTNDFLIRTEDKLAISYNDSSPLENYHVSSAWMEMHNDSSGCFHENMQTDDKHAMRSSIIELVLGTDMKKHFQLLNLFSIALKAADLGHLASPLHVHKRWTRCLETEFFKQGDIERERGMAISALMDRHNCAGITKSQVGFFEIVALPLFTDLARTFPGSQPMLEHATRNYTYWRDGGVSVESRAPSHEAVRVPCDLPTPFRIPVTVEETPAGMADQ
ncbi:hypothetical protein WJX74_009466 [Apatococcus lobatus]|uniref:Phosphodiesterase n=1 Tax=Apatococcus lobatus TaxID=904363 RepID=A0AAW1QN04_9CHLO